MCLGTRVCPLACVPCVTCGRVAFGICFYIVASEHVASRHCGTTAGGGPCSLARGRPSSGGRQRPGAPEEPEKLKGAVLSDRPLHTSPSLPLTVTPRVPSRLHTAPLTSASAAFVFRARVPMLLRPDTQTGALPISCPSSPLPPSPPPIPSPVSLNGYMIPFHSHQACNAMKRAVPPGIPLGQGEPCHHQPLVAAVARPGAAGARNTWLTRLSAPAAIAAAPTQLTAKASGDVPVGRQDDIPVVAK